jgi:peptide/nickel transport system substrate-binding protein
MRAVPHSRLLIGALLIAVAMAGAGCDRDRQDVARVGVIGSTPKLVETVEAPLSTGDALVRSSTAQGLVRFDARGQVVPGLAERWNVSDDGLSYIFRLQTGEWPDGRKIKAADVAKILTRQLRPASRNPLKDTLGAVRDIVAMTDRVIEVRLNAPRPYLLQLLAQPEFGLVRSSVGMGPFKPAPVEERPTDATEDELYFTHRIVIPDAKDPIEKVLIRGGEAGPLVRAFVAGEVQLVLGGTIADLPVARRANIPRGALRFDPVAGLFGLQPTRRNDALQEVEVRRLLSQAIDRTSLIAALNVDGLTPRATILQVGMEGVPQMPQPAWLSRPMAERQPALIAEANRLFGKSERPTLRLSLPDGPGGTILLNRLAADWGLLGIKVERASSPASADLIWVDEVSPSVSPAWLLRHFRCGQAPICVADADPLLASARIAPIAAQRAAAFLEAARMMDEAQLFLAVAAPIRWSLVSSEAPGFEENPFARHTLVGLSDTRISGDTP